MGKPSLFHLICTCELQVQARNIIRVCYTAIPVPLPLRPSSSHHMCFLVLQGSAATRPSTLHCPRCAPRQSSPRSQRSSLPSRSALAYTASLRRCCRWKPATRRRWARWSGRPVRSKMRQTGTRRGGGRWAAWRWRLAWPPPGSRRRRLRPRPPQPAPRGGRHQHPQTARRPHSARSVGLLETSAEAVHPGWYAGVMRQACGALITPSGDDLKPKHTGVLQQMVCIPACEGLVWDSRC